MNRAAAAWLITFLTLGAAVACASSSGDDDVQPVLAASGADLYRQHCGSCHGIWGRGDGPVAGALKTPPADLSRIAARRGGNFPDVEIASTIDGRFRIDAHGDREMPIWGRDLGEALAPGTHPDEVARGRILALVEYLKTLQRP